MPTVRYSIATGTGTLVDTQVTQAVGAATVTQAIEITIEHGATVLNGGTAALQKVDVINALEIAKGFIAERPWPPQ